MSTGIAYVDESWNPVTGCTKVSAGCKHCYAEGIHTRFWGDFGTVCMHPDRLDTPRKWRKPRRVLVCSMGDLFHEKVDVGHIRAVYSTMAETPHTYLVFTKREWRRAWLYDQGSIGPLPNVIECVSVEDQATADERIPVLLETPAARRGLSIEPLLGPIHLRDTFEPGRIHWAAIGCESGPKRRSCSLRWVADLVEQLIERNVSVFVKQLDINGRVSHDPDEWPAARRRELP